MSKNVGDFDFNSLRSRRAVYRSIFVLLAIAGCDAGPAKGPARQGGADAERSVREILSKRLKVDAAAIPMDRPISEVPLKADDLDLVEIVMELEERHGVEISDDAVERLAGGKLGNSQVRITPNQLVRILREAPKMHESRKRR